MATFGNGKEIQRWFRATERYCCGLQQIAQGVGARGRKLREKFVLGRIACKGGGGQSSSETAEC